MNDFFKLIRFKNDEKEKEIIKERELRNSFITLVITGELIDSIIGNTVCEINNLLFGKEIYGEDTSKTSPIKCKTYSLLAIIKSSDIKNIFKISFKILGAKNSSINFFI